MTKKLLIAALLAGAAGGGYWLQRELAGPDPVTANAPASATAAVTRQPVSFTLPDLDGQPRSIDEWRGDALLVNFWATWCAPCRREIPLLKAVQDAHGSDGITVVGVAVDYPEDVAAYAETADFNYPVLVGEQEAIDAAEAAGIEFIGLPFTIAIAPDGHVVKVYMGEIFEDDLEEATAVLKRLRAGDLSVDAARATLDGP